MLLAARTEAFATYAPEALNQAVASAPGASYLLAEPEQAAFVVGSVSVASQFDEDDEPDVAAGEAVEVEVIVENKGDVEGTRTVSLALDETVDTEVLDIKAHTAKLAVLEYETDLAEADQTLGFTVDCETDATDLDVVVGEPSDGVDADAAERGLDDSTASGETGDVVDTDDEADIENGADAATDEADLDAGTRTGLLDRILLEKGTILSYAAAVVLVYSALQNLGQNVYAATLGLFLGVMALPIVRAQLPTAKRIWITRIGKIVAVVFVALFSGLLFDPQVVYDTVGGLLP